MSEPGSHWTASRLEHLVALRRLGLRNVIRVGAYRAAIRAGVWRLLTPIGKGWSEPLFTASEWSGNLAPALTEAARSSLVAEADEIVSGRLRMYSGAAVLVGDPPLWHVSTYDESNSADPAAHWSCVRTTGDIKDIWEPSRFAWAPVLARAWKAEGSSRYLESLNRWVGDWAVANPVNAGANWACGQETSIRLMHVLLASEIIGSRGATLGLARFVREHVRRIAATTAYAIGQDNNHGTSEAVGLYVGGLWLTRHGDGNAARYVRRGRSMLEERVLRLVMPDGSFSQYSVNYHRLLLDTLCVAEWYRSVNGDAPFSGTFYERARAATSWLYEMVDPLSGDAPNIGANDGARLLGLTSGPYRDFRPTAQLACALFHDKRAYDYSECDEPLLWLGLDLPAARMEPALSQTYQDGGWATLHAPVGDSWACLRFPVYRFRPSHADALHLDLWSGGLNVLRDGGTFGYTTDSEWLTYFAGTASHNTVQFDGRDQMPRIGRFLFGKWLHGAAGELHVTPTSVGWSGSYRDARGCVHRRDVEVAADTWTVTDTIDGPFKSAVVRWRLTPGDYTVTGSRCTSEHLEMTLDSDVELEVALLQGWESQHYHEKTELPLLEAAVHAPCTVTTVITLKKRGQ